MKHLLLLFTFVLSCAASETEQAETPTGVGPERAILEASSKEGMKLSDAAILTLGIHTQPIISKGAATFTIPSDALIAYQEHLGVYRFRQSWFKLLDVRVLSKSAAQSTVQSSDLIAGDRVVTSGAPLLRLGELDIWSGGGDAE